MTKWIDLDGVVNMRDLGDLPTHSGRRTREGRLIRSDNLQDLSATDIRHLVDVLHISDIVDLRSETERSLTGPAPLTATPLAHHNLSFVREGGFDVGRDEVVEFNRDEGAVGRRALAMPWQDRPGERSRADFWTQHYLGYLNDRPDSVGGALEVIADSSGGTVVHCAAGKDRTGTVTALALSVAGVPDEEIVADYAASAERIERIVERLVDVEPYAAGLRGRSLDEQRPKPETMAAILTRLGEDFGGAAGWLREQGWGEDRLDALRSRLVD